jgi:hypothetical protein
MRLPVLRRFIRRSLLIPLQAGACLTSAQAARAEEPAPPDPHVLRVEAGVEHLWPVHADRQIATTSANVVLGAGVFGSRWLVWRAGLTLTYAEGYIVQWNEHFRDVRFDTSAGGLGPVVLLRVQAPELARVKIAFEGSGAVLLYTRGFPAGGDRYNFMWRAGPSLEAHLSGSYWLGAGLRWMHVSNGQGLVPRNPAYNARGVSVWLGRRR